MKSTEGDTRSQRRERWSGERRIEDATDRGEEEGIASREVVLELGRFRREERAESKDLSKIGVCDPFEIDPLRR